MNGVPAKVAQPGGHPDAAPQDRHDEDLLDQFLRGAAPESQDAFRALVGRHGPAVLAICRRVLDREHDAEDAFQATFLVLVRDGASISDRRALRRWIREVALRVALRVRSRAQRRRVGEARAMAVATARRGPRDQDAIMSLTELRPVMHEELTRLPEKYRVPVILGYLEGRTNQEVADLLSWPVGTVKGRLLRARRMLQLRLTRRGVAPFESRTSC